MMKRITLLLLSFCMAAFATAQLQQIKIVSFNVKNQLPAKVDEWNNVPGALILVAQKNPGVMLREVKLVVQIRSNSAVICGGNPGNGIPVSDFNTKTYTTNELTGGLINCPDLKDGSYTICAQFFNIDRLAVSQEVCRDFKVESPKAEDYAPPTLITPDNGKSFTEAELSRPVTFRWTPLVPKPKEPVTYRLKVWQLMQGQNGLAAIRSNQPIVTKDVDNITQAVVSGIYTGPCRPPYLCDFVWMVQGLDRNSKPMGRNNGNSEPYSFSAKQNEKEELKNLSPVDNKKFADAEAKNPLIFKWTPLTPKPSAPVTYRLRVWQLMQGQNATQAMRTNKPIVTKDVADITEATVSGIYTGPCRPPYLCDFVWNVQVVTRDGTQGTASEPTAFAVTQEKSKGPDNVFPEDKKKFNADEVKQSITFRWTPIVPKPQEPVTYKLRVWQLMQGQNATQAMRTNKPIITKDVDNITETTVSGIYTGPCRPPYLCDFVWNVEAVTKQASGATEVIGSSTATMFMITQYIIQLDSIKVNCTATPGVYSFSYTITNPNAGTAKLTNFVATSSTPGGASISSFAPPLNTNISAGNQLTITGTINGSPSLSNICIGAEITDIANTFWKASKDTCVNVQPCKCEKCDGEKVVFNIPNNNTVTFNNNNTFSFTQPLTITTNPLKLVKDLKAELVYYEYVPENEDCLPCNKDSKTYGNFASGTIGNVNGTGAGSHSLDFIFSPSKNFSTTANANITITMPPSVSCCNATIRWCIRWIATFEDGKDCFVCSKLVCYEKKKDGCIQAAGGGIKDPK